MSKLPTELINLIMSYMSSSIAFMFKKDWLVIDTFNHLNEKSLIYLEKIALATTTLHFLFVFF